MTKDLAGRLGGHLKWRRRIVNRFGGNAKSFYIIGFLRIGTAIYESLHKILQCS